MQVFVVLTTTPDLKSAGKIAKILVTKRLAACVSYRGGFKSVYSWKKRMRVSDEALLVIKTSPRRFPALEKTLRAIHPYEVPEILALPAMRGSRPYLNWMKEALG